MLEGRADPHLRHRPAGDRPVRAAEARANVRLRDHALRLHPPGPRRHLPHLRRPHPKARGARPRGGAGPQCDRRRRLDPAQGPPARGQLPGAGRRRDGPLPLRHGGPGGAAAGGGAPGHRGRPPDHRPRGPAPRAGQRLPGRRVGVLRHRHVPGLRLAVPLRPGGDAPHRRRSGRPPRRPGQARPPRLHPLAAVGPRRAGLGRPLRPRPARLAHRVLGHGAGRPRPHPRPPRRPRRPPGSRRPRRPGQRHPVRRRPPGGARRPRRVGPPRRGRPDRADADGVSRRIGFLVGAAVLAAAGAVVPSGGAGAQTATMTREQAVRQVLDQRVDALKRGDRAAFLDTVDPSATDEFKARQGRLYDGLRSLPLAFYELRLRTDEVPDLAGGGLAGRYPGADAVFLPPVEAHYRLTGIDTVDAVDGYYFTFLLRGGQWRVVSDRDVEDVGLPSARNLWDYGPVTQERTAHFTVFHDPADRKRAGTLATLCEQAYARLSASFSPDGASGARSSRQVPPQIVVVLPHNLDQLREILQATFDLPNFVAFASASVDRDVDWQSTAPRVYVQDANLSRSRRDFQLQTFHHEFTHVAAFPLAGPFVPSWIHEGLAD